MKIKKKIIRIFVNNEFIIEISPYASIYSLKDEIQKKIYDNLKLNKILLLFNGKPLNDNKTLISYNINDNSNISASPIVNGGEDINWFWEWGSWILYIMIVLGYLIFLASGLPPLVSNIFAVIFNSTIGSVLKHITDNKWVLQIVNFILKIIMMGITFFFVWAVTSFVISPWLFSFKHNYCGSGLAAKDVGFTVAWIYVLIYGSYNIIDFILNIVQEIVSNRNDPLIIEGITNMTLQSSKRGWDILKFSPLYLIPVVGQLLLIYHSMIEEGFGLMYSAIYSISTFQCDNPKLPGELCSFLTGLQESLNKRSKGPTSSTNKLKQKGIEEGKQIIQDKKANISLLSEMGYNQLIPTVKNYHLGPIIKLLQRGFCDISIKDSGKEIPELKGTEWDTDTVMGKINRWSAGIMPSVFCQFTEAIDDTQRVLGEVGTEDQLINMMKTGNVAGMASATVLIIYYILSLIPKWVPLIGTDSFGGSVFK